MLLAGSGAYFFSYIHSKPKTASVQSTVATSDPSKPNLPPVINSLPSISCCKRLFNGKPLTSKPNSGPCTKFQVKCSSILNHRFFCVDIIGAQQKAGQQNINAPSCGYTRVGNMGQCKNKS